MEYDLARYSTSEEFIRDRAREGAGFAIDEEFTQDDWPNVAVLDLSDGWIWVTNREVAWLNEPKQRLERLWHLDLRNTCIDDGFIDEITRPGSNLARIGHLVVSGHGVFDEGAREIAWPNAGLPNLEVLEASCCGISDDGLWELLGPESRLRSLETLKLSHNSQIGPAGTERLGKHGAGPQFLKRLSLAWCGLSDGVLLDLAGHAPDADNFPNLQRLSLAGNTLSQEDVEWFAQSGHPLAQRLTLLNLSGCGDFPTLFRVLARDGCCMDNLRVLRLRETGLTAASLLGLRDPQLFPALQVIDVRKNRVTAKELMFLFKERPGLHVIE